MGLQPGWDPAYQPMWFLKALFGVLFGETVLINASDFVARKVAAARKCRRLRVFDSATFCEQPQVVSNGWAASLRRMVFPVYVMHSMWLSVAGIACRFSCLDVQMFSCLGIAIAAVGLSVLSAVGLKKLTPRFAGLLFGGR